MQSRESQRQWIETLRLNAATVDRAIDEANHVAPDDEGAAAICALIGADTIPGCNLEALATFRAGVLFGVNMTRIAIEDAPLE